jgi:uncharacterized small protein (DUF1192 family)
VTSASRGGAGQRVHVLDTAVLFAELELAPNTSQADIARRYRRSPGYVSVLCRFGHAVRHLPPEARDHLRVGTLTFKGVQHLVSRHADPVAVLRAAQALAARPARPRAPRARLGAPSQWDHAPAGPDAIDPLPESPAARPDLFSFHFDEQLARRDPAAALAAFEAHVRAATDEVVARLRRAAGDVGPPPAREGLTPVGRPDAAARAARAALDELSLRQLHERVGATLRAHRERMAAFLSERDRSRASARAAGRAAGPDGSLTPLPVSPDDIEADLS